MEFEERKKLAEDLKTFLTELSEKE